MGMSRILDNLVALSHLGILSPDAHIDKVEGRNPCSFINDFLFSRTIFANRVCFFMPRTLPQFTIRVKLFFRETQAHVLIAVSMFFHDL